MVHNCLCQAKDLRYNEVLPGRLLQVRVPGSDTSIDAISFYQFVWRSKQTVSQNKEQRHAALQKLHQTISSLPQRNSFIVAGGFNMSLRTDRKHVGPCTASVSRLGHRGSKDLQRMMEQHQLVAANTWSVRKPATHVQGNSVSQIDYVLIRRSQSQGPGKSCSPGSRHFPLRGKIINSRRCSATVRKPYDQDRMQDCYRLNEASIQRYTDRVDTELERKAPSWEGLREAMASALVSEFPKHRERQARVVEGAWEQHRSLRNLKELIAISALPVKLKLRVVWCNWTSLARQSSSARQAKQRKFANRQAPIDDRQNTRRQRMAATHFSR